MGKTKSEFLKAKFEKLKDEGYAGKQRVAVALSYARKAGYGVPPPPHKSKSVRYIKSS